LRKTLRDGEAGARFITTVYGGGYCFVTPVELSDAPVQPVSAEPSPQIPHRLPLYSSRMIGRDETLRDVAAQVRAERLVTVVGPGGIGKTMLAVAVARALLAEFDGEIVFFDLAPIQDSNLVPGIVAATLGLIQSDDPIAGVIAFLRNKRILLVLDSCEHVIGQVALVAEKLFQANPQIYMLATSREALRIQGEHLRTLPPLAYPPSADLTSQQILSFPAAQLLVERVIANGYSLELDGPERALVAEISRALDGIPLAIELAAGRIGALGLQETAARLNSRIELLWQGRRTAPPRHQTLGATLDWSYHLLSDGEQTVLRRLSAFAGHFSLDAARSVASSADASENQVVTALAGLVAKSLVAVNATGPTPTYRLLDTTRTYAQIKLIESGDAEQTSLAHAVYFLGLLETTSSGPPSPRDGKLFSDFGIHIGNVRAALEWSFLKGGNIGVALPLAAASVRMLMEQSLLVECRDWSEHAIGMLDEATRGSRLEMELQAAFGFACMQIEGNTKRAEDALNRGLALAEDLGHLQHQLRLLSRLHLFHSRIGQFRTALEFARRSVPVADKIADPMAIAEAHTIMGASRLFEGNPAIARRYFEAALVELPISSQADVFHFGALDFRARVQVAMAQALWLEGLPEQSIAIARDSVDKAGLFNHPVTICIVHVLAIRAFLWNRNFADAERSVQKMTETADEQSLLPYQAVARAIKGELQICNGDPAAGVAQLRAALSSLHAVRYELQTTSFMAALAEGLAMTGQYAAALQAADDVIAVTEDHGDLFIMPELLRIKGAILILTGADPAAVERCLQAAHNLAARQQAPAWQLRAATSLARFRLDRGHREEARTLLAPVVGRFTQGLDHADLVAARSLLVDIG
jgi:predicted ATPase